VILCSVTLFPSSGSEDQGGRTRAVKEGRSPETARGGRPEGRPPRGAPCGDPRGDPQSDLLSAADAALYQELRVWRAEVAMWLASRFYMILTNRQLRDIVRVRPASLAALGGISGIGQARLQKYGRVLLERVRGGADLPAEPWSAPMSGPDAAESAVPGPDATISPVPAPQVAAAAVPVAGAPAAGPSSEIPAHA